MSASGSAGVGIGCLVGDRYFLKRHLGAGRYGDVYLAVDQVLSGAEREREHRVALHLVHPHVARQSRLLQKLEQVCREPQLWAHPNVIRVLGFGSNGQRYFFVTELLDGATLRVVLEDSPEDLLSESEVLAVLRGVGDGLRYAHAKGAVHGDLRPEKIFLTHDYEVKVLDLLPATSARGAEFFVEDATPTGPQQPDPRDDVYGLACLAYEMISGKHPFNGNSPLDAFRAHLPLAPIPRLDSRRWAVLERGLALHRAARTASVQEFLEEIGVVGDERLRTARSTQVSLHEERPKIAATVPPSLAADLDRIAEAVVRPAQPRRHRGITWAILLAVMAVAGGVAAYVASPEVQGLARAWLVAGEARTADLRRTLLARLNRAAGVPSPVEETVSAATVAGPVRSSAPEAEPVADSTVAPASSAAVLRTGERAREALQPVSPREPVRAPTPLGLAAGTLAFTASTIAVAESRPSAVAEIRLSGGTEDDPSVVWWTSDGSAVADNDYVSFGARVETFAPGERTLRVFVPLVGDSEVEANETFRIHARASDGSRAPLPGATPEVWVEVVIRDDD